MYDVLEIIKSEVFNFEMTGIELPGSAKENLCVRAYEMMKKEFHLPPVSMYLLKNIPAGSGTGGGSSDAANTILLLNRIFDLKLSEQQCADRAQMLGSDCAFFIYNKPMFASGRGEILEEVELDMQRNKLLIAFPGISVSTPWAYSQILPKQPEENLKNLIQLPKSEWKTEIKNDFEEIVFKRYQAIGDLKDSMYSNDAWYAGMTGSGSSVFGLFDLKTDLTELKQKLNSQNIKCFETIL